MTFGEYVNNKRIAVIGPAPSAFQNNNPDKMESFDLVMRFNSAVPLTEEVKNILGPRTDILCNCLEPHPISGGKVDPEIWIKENVKWIISPYPKDIWFAKSNIDRFISLNKSRLGITCFDLNQYNVIENEIKTRPNSGILGIMHLLNYNVKELYITGITFGRGGYHKGYKDDISPEQYDKLANGKWHSQKPQETFFKKLYKENKNIIKVDITLKSILEE